MGYQREAVMPRAMLIDGEFIDGVMMSLMID
jgi:RimJ/RimL family protein N-acetyltransferase